MRRILFCIPLAALLAASLSSQAGVTYTGIGIPAPPPANNPVVFAAETAFPDGPPKPPESKEAKPEEKNDAAAAADVTIMMAAKFRYVDDVRRAIRARASVKLKGGPKR